MKFELPYGADNIFILGAGASVEYGLPIWSELEKKIREKVTNDKTSSFQYRKQILSWIDKVGNKKLYSTLDECISSESVSQEHHTDGVDVENEIFSIIKSIFSNSYKSSDEGWIKKLNEKILHSPGLEKKLSFINYNYDHVLDDNFLNYEYLPIKYRRLNYRPRLSTLSGVYVPMLCPHGTLFPPTELTRPSHLNKFFDTIKTGDSELLDVVSCYESKQHTIATGGYDSSSRNLYILGLGGGLAVNLSNLIFKFPIKEIHVTIKNKELVTYITDFLAKKFSLPPGEIKMYEDCSVLVETCF